VPVKLDVIPAEAGIQYLAATASAVRNATEGLTMFTLYRYPFAAMGSRCEIRLYAPSEEPAAACARAAIKDVLRLETKYSRYRDASVTAAINRVAAAGVRSTSTRRPRRCSITPPPATSRAMAYST
jgi:hypothetical protein